MAEMTSLSTEYGTVSFTSSLTPVGGTGEVAFTPFADGTAPEPVELDWVAADIVAVESAPSGFTGKLRVLIGPLAGDVDPGDGVYQAWVRLVVPGSPERPVRRAGLITIT